MFDWFSFLIGYVVALGIAAWRMVHEDKPGKP